MADNSTEEEQTVWWLRWLTRGVGTLGAISAGIGGVFMILTGFLHITSIVAGCVMLLLAFIMCVLEATIICSGVSFAQPLIQRIDSIKNWHRGATYCGLSVIAIGLGWNSILTAVGSLAIPFACGTLYGMMALGKKGDREAMMNAASGNNYTQFDNEP
ncbi:Oidioi.mRNA.OKI2018_I69.XSR.g13312.t1.cds [Oikopleura dioica]|uniref:Oidioi.mRNA.OKI2018_I69.XSR.g13312.t1.cds n=1 Tax=Oikopleura dioica TaxID=34765 RepID=A0ABN7S6I2_OIKDI|nr:Oidioi.mRNA.OKI2018_I69.XSR.g13312.t1.cds [Oikopleura dioica]